MLAPAASAYNDGRGFYGATNDKVVTVSGFSVIIFFPLFVFSMSMIQRALESARKPARPASRPFARRSLARRLVAPAHAAPRSA